MMRRFVRGLANATALCAIGFPSAVAAQSAPSAEWRTAQYYERERRGEGRPYGHRPGYGEERRSVRFHVGQSVLARSAGGPRYFPGVVTRVDGDTLTVFYASSLTERRPAWQVRPYDWRNGDRVWCFPGRRPGAPLAPARIERLDVPGANTAMTVRYDNGGVERTTSAWCHSR
ncbi:hypothetical protein [Hansschlegelia beijingensis]|uniref:Secreted protein n=1 Tax=Hansschlegelia beijingensis TaxID=1133344 RepID=A0A7W6GFA6_9HYPH|nr:hypothetical protein [Hansschlegelia beijingensis]MBB3972737.1 hypothetical protein [Hansschlegelia beijingensis]